ncbi:MAG TPA: condensation domain-containing protein [Edaphobacter sp.]|nr:condensation domain-containing protein [Edaphobacter sp.]
MATSHTKNLLRPLGPSEHYFWLSNQNSAKHFVIAAEVLGDATTEAWISAVAAAQLRHPFLRCSVEYGLDGQPCFREHPNVSIPLRLVPEEGPATWQVEMAKELTTPIPLSGAPLVRIALLRASGGSTLLLSMHHSIADGISSAFVIRDILEALSGDPLQPLTPTEPQENLCSAAADPLPRPSAPVYPAATLLRRDVQGPKVQALKLSKELTTKLRTHAREVGATVHGALVAALTFSGRQLSRDWLMQPVRVISPVNNRKLLGLKDQCTLSIIFPTGAYAPDSEERLWDVARSVTNELAPLRTVEGLSIVFSGFRRLMSTSPDVAQVAAFELQVCACEGMVSNLGILPFETSFGKFKLESLWGPAVFVGIEGEQMIGVVTLNGSMHLLHTSYTPIPKLLQAMEWTLEAMAR